jgi:hypothetical protein
MTNKELYRQLCETEGSRIPLFQQYWWMETVCEGKEWDVLLSQKEGRIEGALPYLIGHRMGLRFIVQPQLTQYCGPWYNPPQGANRPDFEHRVGAELAGQLLGLKPHIFVQHFSPKTTDWLPFYWAGFQQTTRYTYRFPSIADADMLYAQASRARRQNMADVEQCCTLDKSFSPIEFAAMHHDYFVRRKGSNLLQQSFVELVCATALQRGQALLWALRNKVGKAVNVSFVVYDDQCAYALMSAITDDAPRNSQTYLFWQMIRHLSTVTQSFDFEGSMDAGNEYFYRTFGTVQTPFFEVTHFSSPIARLIFKLKTRHQ